MGAAPADDTARSQVFRAPAVVLALLALTAGFADGYALTRFDVFVANQSGNIVRVGMGLAGEYSAWDLALLSILGFAVGGLASRLLAGAAMSRGLPVHVVRLIAVAVLVTAWWVLVIGVGEQQQAGRISAFVGAAAMGVVATILTHVAGVRAQPAFQTANVLSSAQGLLDWAAHTDPVERRGRQLAAVGGLTIACYAIGGGTGAWAAQLGPSALLFVLLPLLGCLLLSRRSAAADAGASDQ